MEDTRISSSRPPTANKVKVCNDKRAVRPQPPHTKTLHSSSASDLIVSATSTLINPRQGSGTSLWRSNSAQDIHTSISMATRPLTVHHGGNLVPWQHKHTDKKRDVLPAHKAKDGIQVLSNCKTSGVERNVNKHVEPQSEKAVEKVHEENTEKDHEEVSLDVDQLLKGLDLMAEFHEAEPSTIRSGVGVIVAEQPLVARGPGNTGTMPVPPTSPPLVSHAPMSEPPSLSMFSQPATSCNSVSEERSAYSEDSRCAAAAVQIQRWYRSVRKLCHQSQVLSLLQEKKAYMAERSMQGDALKDLSQKDSEGERQKRRAVKMQAARRAAIESLQQKREQKRLEAERIAQEEIALLHESGKIKKHKRTTRSRKSKSPAAMKGQQSDDVCATTIAPQESIKASHLVKQLSEVSVVHEVVDSRRAEQTSPLLSVPLPLASKGPTDHSPDSHPKSTFKDVLAALQLLEEEPSPLQPLHSAYLPTGTGEGFGPPPTSLDPGRLQNILAYLDEMEKEDEHLKDQLTSSHQEAKLQGIPQDIHSLSTKDVLAEQLQAASAVASDVTSTILTQRMELENKNKTVEMLQKALTQQRELTVYHAKEVEKEGQRRLDLQKQEYEATIQRHQCFIDQLIDDKKVISEKCEKLVAELKEMDSKYKQKIKTMTESHAAEVAQQKQVALAAEKLRQEKWRTQETKRIKETTVKSLEPEIQRIIAKGKAEIQKLKALHEAELLKADELVAKRYIAQMEELRVQSAHEREQACAHERELARQKYEKLAEQEELNYQQQRRRLFAEIEQEKERLAQQGLQDRAQLDTELSQVKEQHVQLVNDMKASHQKSIEEVQRRHVSEMKELEERLNIEKQAWEENYMKKQQAVLMGKERELRERLRMERDKEIEVVITRLEQETASVKEESEKAAESKIRRIREKYEAELREVERSEKGVLEKFSTMKERQAELEGESSRLRALLRQKEYEVDQVNAVVSRLTQERDRVTEVVRQEFVDKLVVTEEENKQLKHEISELRARHKLELERACKASEKELTAVHERVKQALAKKEENLKTLRTQHEAALKRAEHLEMLLETQRRELVKK